ncbi:TetR/AcrR family transcriptional regulator [Ramlibacter sp. PS4R-6]|uniref:TetR/AcrR family transcriptional regulator n=1 Tax=Ramlibacter sp. PS4R-6 TaxID=3133438 RepID=UPI0030A5DE6F
MEVAAPTRDKLLDAAAQLFYEQGYSATSMDQVRQAAGVSNGSLYHHFPTKAQLADALYVQTLHDFHGALLAPIARDVTAEAGVKALVRAHVNWVLKNPARAALLHKLKREGEVTDKSADISAANTEAYATLRAWVDRKTEAGEMRAVPFYLWMSLVFAPAMGLNARWTKEPNVNVPPKVRAALEHAAWMAVAP